MNAVQVKTSSDGEVIYPELHDAQLIKLELKGDSNLEVDVLTEGGEKYRLLFSGIQLLKSGDFGTQNVILEVNYYYGINPTKALKSTSDFLYKKSDKDIAELAKKIVNKKLGYFDLSSSVGCYLLCVCQKIEIKKV